MKIVEAARLTAREAECLSLVLTLHTNDAIARELGLSTNTVRNHIKAARDKLGGLGRYDAARRHVEASERPASIEAEAPSSGEGARGDATSSNGVLERPFALFGEARAAFDHQDSAFGHGQAPEFEGRCSPRRGVGMVASAFLLAAAIAVLLVATPPMAASFSRLAHAVKPWFAR